MPDNILKFSFFIVVISLASLPAYSQPGKTGLDTPIKKFQRYADDRAFEKAYLQFDKPYYAVGDTIYFKAYITLGAQHKLSAVSGVVHIDLVDPANKINQSIQLQVVAGTAWGDFVLADSLKSGNYHVRAYTNWMRNEGEDSFFDQLIPIASIAATRIPEGGKLANTTAKMHATIHKTDIQFMPEGGSLIAGNYSKMAFKAIIPDGLGTEVKGTLIDDSGTSICAFATGHLGMGVFSFVPEAGKSYKANLTYANGTTNTVDLPRATTSGYTLTLNNTDPDSVRLRVTAGSESPMDKLSLVAQSGGIIYYVAQNQSGNKLFSAVIPKSKFPTGIVQFTLFSAEGEPLNERLVFINNNDQLKLTVASKEKYAPRQKVEIKLTAKDKNDKNITAGSFSISVTDESKVPVNETSENSILSNLLLTSELKGTVEQPNYYFTDVNEKTNADLDLLMLTQGYRHFSWKQVLSDSLAPEAYQPEKTLQISGTVKTSGGKPVTSAKVTLFTKSGGPLLMDTLTNTNGKFTFSNLTFGDSVKFVVQAKVDKGQDNVVLDLDNVAAPAITDGGNLVNPILSDTSAYLANERLFYQEQLKYGINKHTLMLKEVVVRDKKAPKELEHSQNLNGKGNADQVVTAKDLEALACAKLLDCLQAKLTGITFVSGLGGRTTMYVRRLGGLDITKSSRLPDPMQVVVDGNFVDFEVANDLNSDDIDAVEVIMGPHYGAIYGSRGAAGMLIITTKRASKANNYYRYAPGVVTYMPKGFYKAREFYSPRYDRPGTNKQMADLRSTIFWKPDITIGKDGTASFGYFSADGKGTYRVVVEGIDADGNLGRQVYRYKVE